MRLMRVVLAATLCAFSLLSSAAHAASEYAKTKYPIILVHGVAGTSKYFGVIDYWWQIKSDLTYYGANVYVANLNSFAGENLRGEKLLETMRAVMIQTGAAKVNLIAHSQGGLTSRYAAAAMPEAIASITTIGTPHRGTHLADWIASTPTIFQDFLAGSASLAGGLLDFLVGDPLQQDPFGALRLMTQEGMVNFNSQFPSAGLGPNCSTSGASVDVKNGNVQRLYSWTGSSGGTNIFDALDPLLVLGDWTIRLRGGGSNDGMVPVCSARFGQVIGTYGWNHVDEINHLFGLRGLFTADPVVVIRTHANRLKQAGV
ncbi:triacylglycerol lipase [Herbaspirillum sp. ST 5-3]|uniref:lipase family alpha/beta hydrolase n=1 Tax=Oxalobacteraceae TaxID=75682 RepID=UPI0010A4B554|nr:triacylglycerol lipase [Herbaspirillum sp. ST 5-3]